MCVLLVCNTVKHMVKEKKDGTTKTICSDNLANKVQTLNVSFDEQ